MSMRVADRANSNLTSFLKAQDLLGRSAERILVPASVIAALVFVIVGIGRPVFLDEAYSVIISSHGFSGVIDELRRDNNLPAYYLVLSVWIRLFGDSETAVRLLSGIFYLGGCAGVYLLGLRLAGNRRAACYSAVLYEASVLAIRHAQNIRAYSLLGALSAFSCLAFLRIFRDRDQALKTWAMFFAVNVAGVFTHVWFCFVLLGQFIAIVVFERRQIVRFVSAAFMVAVPFTVLWGRSFISQLHNGATDWMPGFRPLFFLQAAADPYGLRTGCILFMFGAGAWVIAGRAKRREALPATGIGLLLTVAVACILIPVLASAVRPIYYPHRYTIIAVAPLAAVLGSMLALLAPRALCAVAALALITTQIAAHVSSRSMLPNDPGASDKPTVDFLLTHAAPGDAVVFTSLTRGPADYYFHRAGANGRWLERSFPASTASHLGWIDTRLDEQARSSLCREAADLAQELRANVARGATVWVYDGHHSQISKILLDELNADFALTGRHAFRAPFHDALLEYRDGSRLPMSAH